MTAPTIAEAVAPTAGADGVTGPATAPVRRMLWRLAPAGPPSTRRSLRGRRAVVIGGDPDTAARVGAALRERGVELVEVPDPAGRPGPGAPDVVVDLTVADRITAPGGRHWREALLRTFTVLRHCYGEWSAETSADRLTYLAVSYLGGGMGHHLEDDIAQPLGGLWAGLAKSLHRELPNCTARVLDIGLDDLELLPELVAEELSLPGLTEIGRRDGRRWVLTPEAVPAGEPEVRWTSADTLLISGGGRGIGMALARELTREFGLRVVVTGRVGLPPEESWPELTPEALRQRRTELWAQHREGRPVADIRREITRTEATWELVGNLVSARAEGLRLDYRACDFTDPASVRRLVAEFPDLTGVIHNAGVDTPTRLPNKSDDEIGAVVATKVDSFLHLLDAVRDLPLKVFCTVGSLTGRLGGMVGQLDYAAANEALARLGLWAQREVAFPVMTLAWPTWDRLGLVANFGASLRYMAAMDVAEGLRHWRSELLAGSRGEISFVGPLGRALSPAQAVSYPVVPQLPGFEGTFPKIFHLGTVLEYQPHARFVSEVDFGTDTAPAVGDFLVHGEPALPVSLLLESAVRGAEWVTPEHLPELVLLSVEELSVPLDLLRSTDGRVRLRREVRGAGQDGQWAAEVTFRPVGGGPSARMRLLYREAGAAADPVQGAPAAPAGAAGPDVTVWGAAPTLDWRGLVVPLSHWEPQDAERIVAEVRRSPSGDLWTLPEPPACAVPVAVLENILRAAVGRGVGWSGSSGRLDVARIQLRGPEGERTRITGDPRLGVWRAVDALSGESVAVVTGLSG
ncbi:KR domain-containing protein [Streptomyces sp. NBC_00249]|uniref:KR domain-containing protein n=1 Tax=Streptomyces sp. NBC_00249 TaxID=2975690 RepID=UPI00225B82DE|nr:KR domain-containing protein [Streptomyces sp. NBC_00249]MCX5197377.1 KR domain-containing protein [Streptomyces sp. NBC_00249]